MTHTRPETIDEHGIRHRYGCFMPGWTTAPSSIRGFAWASCVDCGALRLARHRRSA